MDEKKTAKQQSFLQGAAMLAAATIIVKIIGAVYKIPLLGIIDDKGYGYFTTAYDFYSVLLMISTTGLPVAMSRMTSEAGPWATTPRSARFSARPSGSSWSWAS